MKKVIEFFIKNGLFVNILTLVIIFLGVVSIVGLKVGPISIPAIKREAFPNINFDIVSVTTIYPGASAKEVEKLVTNSIEQKLKELDGVKKIQSVSTESRSFISVFFDVDQKTGKEGKEDIKNIVDGIRDLPLDSEDPIVAELETKKTPIIEISVFGTTDEIKLREAGKYIEEQLEEISEVANVVPTSDRKLEIKIQALPRKLKKFSISLEDLIRAVKNQNLSIPGGALEVSSSNKNEKIIRTSGDFSDAEDVKNTVIRASDLGYAIKVKDVANVKLSLTKSSVINHSRGKLAYGLTVLKKQSADTITLVDKVKLKLEEIKPSFSDGISIDLSNDSSYYIRRRLKVLSNNMFVGLFLVLIILALVMKPRISLVVAVGIPLSFLGCIYVLQLLGVSLNLLTLIGLIIVVGMLVDDAIVVSDNIVRHMEEGKEFEQAAIDGTYEVWWPIMASVFTTIFAFGSFLFMTGIFGKFARFIPMGVIIALLLSLVECYFILPHHMAHWLTKNTLFVKDGKLKQNFWDKYISPLYLPVLHVTIKFRYLVALVAIILFVVTVGQFKKMPKILFPPEGIEQFIVKIEGREGASLLETEKAIASLESLLGELPEAELESFTSTIGIQRQEPNDPNTRRGNQYAMIKVFLTPEQKRNRKAIEIIDDIKEKYQQPDNLKKVIFSRINPGPPVGKAISVGVRAKTFEEILDATKKLKLFISEMEGITDIQDSFENGKQELIVKVKNTEAAAAGLSVAQIGQSVRAAFEGIVATTIKKLDEEIDVRVMLPENDRGNKDRLLNLQIPNNRGFLISLRRVATIESGSSIATVLHEAGKRQVNVSAEVNEKITTSIEANKKISAEVSKWKNEFPGVSFKFGGENEDTIESFQSLLRAAIVSGLLVFLMLILLFKNLSQTFLVLITLPLGFIAVIWAFISHSYPFTFMGGLGMVALFGVIVNNAIVFIDFVNTRRASGLSPRESIIDTGMVRIRPIFLTTITSVFGILPTAYGIGGLDEFVVPIALALGWGLFLGSILTSVVLPAAIAINDDLRNMFLKVKKGFS